jgi:hypothetical protein
MEKQTDARAGVIAMMKRILLGVFSMAVVLGTAGVSQAQYHHHRHCWYQHHHRVCRAY